MNKNEAGQKVRLLAVDASTQLPATGVGGTITAYASKDGGALTVLADTTAAELDTAKGGDGIFEFSLTQAESNADEILFTGESSNPDVVVIPRFVATKSAASGGGSGGNDDGIYASRQRFSPPPVGTPTVAAKILSGSGMSDASGATVGTLFVEDQGLADGATPAWITYGVVVEFGALAADEFPGILWSRPDRPHSTVLDDAPTAKSIRMVDIEGGVTIHPEGLDNVMVASNINLRQAMQLDLAASLFKLNYAQDNQDVLIYDQDNTTLLARIPANKVNGTRGLPTLTPNVP